MIAIAIPCYQGAATVGEVVRGARAGGHEVVVVDDGSSDESGRAAEAAGALVLRHPANRGKGAAIATAFAWAARKHEIDGLLTMDADGQHDPAEIPKLAAAHESEPRAVVVGVRDLDAAHMPGRSRFGNQFSTWWISRFARRAHTDTQSGFRVYPRALFAEFEPRSRRFDTETELLLVAAKLKLPLVEVPVATIYGPEHKTHFHGFRDSMRVLKLILSSPFWRLK